MVAPDDKFEKFDKIICSSSSKTPWKRPSWPHSANWYPRVASHSSSSNPSLTSLIRASPPATRSSDSVSSTRRGHSASIATIHRGTASWSARLTSHWASASVSCTLCQVSEDSQEMSIEYYKYFCTFEDHTILLCHLCPRYNILFPFHWFSLDISFLLFIDTNQNSNVDILYWKVCVQCWKYARGNNLIILKDVLWDLWEDKEIIFQLPTDLPKIDF